MAKNINNDVVEDLLHVHRIVHRNLLRGGLVGVDKNISRPLFLIMSALRAHGTMRVSEIGKTLLIPKPQMTHLIDKLYGMNLVERRPDPKDRRITNVALTEDGSANLEVYRKVLRTNIKKKLAALEQNELEELSVALKKIREFEKKLR